MTTASRLFEILDKCNRAYRVSDCPSYNDLLEIKEGDAYYVKID